MQVTEADHAYAHLEDPLQSAAREDMLDADQNEEDESGAVRPVSQCCEFRCQ